MARPANPELLADSHPELAAQAAGWDASTVRTRSRQQVLWRCARGHEWEATPYARAISGSGCPYCSGRRVIPGETDIATLHLDLAAQAYGWDPTTVKPGSNNRLAWRCSEGHVWEVAPIHRVQHRTGCPYCLGRRVSVGVNDLATTHPALAAELLDPPATEVSAGSDRRGRWRCSAGHEWEAVIGTRGLQGNGCPYCAGRLAIAGETDLATLFPAVAAEANGWDPSTVTSFSHARKPWRCALGHEWHGVVAVRTSKLTPCPICSGRLLLAGVNDLATLHPTLALQASGWDPTTVLPNAREARLWRCDQGHEWRQAPRVRVLGHGCPVCANRHIIPGLNDLATTNPSLAAQAAGWDPTKVGEGSGGAKLWRCANGHKWKARVVSRSLGTGCSVCHPHGFDPTKPAYVYLFARPGEQQTGITGNLSRRAREHGIGGWELLDVVGPMDGPEAQEIERQLLRWIRTTAGILPGWREAWSTAGLEVSTVHELANRAGVDLPTR